MNARMWTALALILGVVGCQHQETRLQSADEDEKEAAVKTIGEITEVGNATPVPVSGVGLVVGLEGTGGGAPPGGFRTMLERELQKHNVEHIKEILESPRAAMVLVSGQLPAGARKGDPFDVQITLPPQSKATSLRGGYLKMCNLFNYETKKNLDPNFAGPDSMMIGHPLAFAEGLVVTGFGDGDEAARLKHGVIWRGARSRIERPFYLTLKDGHQHAAVAKQIADRINETFHGGPTDVAIAERPQYVLLRVPQQYKDNLPHYLRVVRLVPLLEAPAPGSPYRHKLEEELLDPAHTVTAALRLEALGGQNLEPLKRGLQGGHPLVRFCAAEALAYLGDASCGQELARAAKEQPLLRAYALTALASLDESICHVKLAELLSSSNQETRYGAFWALHTLDEHEPSIPGEEVQEAFWLYRVAPESPPLVHLSCTRRAEVVLFGESPRLLPPFSFVCGEFTVTADAEDQRCTVSRFSVHHGTSRRQCSLRLEDVLRTVAGLGGLYSDVADLLRQAGQCRSLTCEVAVDVLPQATPVEDLARKAAADPNFMKKDDGPGRGEPDTVASRGR